MLSQDTKRKIQTARDILVGKIPDPKAQVEQITIALMYKFMNDMDLDAISLGGKAKFFSGEFKEYSWTNILDSKKGAQDRLNLYAEAIEKMDTNPNIPQLFRNIFKNAFLPYRDPETLSLFLKQINEFDYEHTEQLGDAFEFLLSIMSSQGDAGQFRTPRHIIDFIVNVVDPKKDQSVLDPACGTAGFLISAYKHVLENNKEKDLTPDERDFLAKNYTGYDISPDMVRLSLVNMYLHGFLEPRIFEYDTLSSEKYWEDKFDVILANPPFMTPKGGIKPHKRFSIQANRSEVLFVDYIIEHLKLNGKAGIIVPEGIIFQSADAYKKLRKKLVEDGLFCVVSLPAGIFQPYSGVKTSVLLFDNEVSKRVDHIMFVKITNDGYSLGAQRNPVIGSDIPMAIEAITEYKKFILEGGKSDFTGWPGIAAVDGNPLCAFSSKEEIAKTETYNLSGDQYRAGRDYSDNKWPMVKLQDVFIEIKNGKNVTQIDENGKYRVSRIQTIANGVVNLEKTKYTNDEVDDKDFLQNGDILFSHINSFEHLAKTAIFDERNEKVVHGANLVRLRPDRNRILSKYALFIFKSEIFREMARRFAQKAVNQASINTTAIKNFEIPLPPLEVQEQIVKELDGYAAIISGAKKIIASWKPRIDIDPEWESIRLGEILDKASEQVDPQRKAGEVFYIGLENIESGSGRIVGKPKSKFAEIKSLKNSFKPGDLLYGKLRPNLNKVWLADREGICSTDILVFRSKKNALANFYWYLLLSDNFVNEVMSGIKGAQLPRVGFEYLSDIVLPLPPIETQKQIVEKIEAERELVESAKKLIKIYEEKSKSALEKLYGDND